MWVPRIKLKSLGLHSRYFLPADPSCWLSNTSPNDWLPYNKVFVLEHGDSCGALCTIQYNTIICWVPGLWTSLCKAPGSESHQGRKKLCHGGEQSKSCFCQSEVIRCGCGNGKEVHIQETAWGKKRETGLLTALVGEGYICRNEKARSWACCQ